MFLVFYVKITIGEYVYMIDLHTHSIFSDGTDTPEAIALKANIVGLKAVALTDHDTVDGLSSFMSMQMSVDTILIPGIELNCQFMGGTLHIVGLFIDFLDTRLISRTRYIQLKRLERNKLVIERLRAKGVSINWDNVVTEAPVGLVSRVHIAKALVNLGAAISCDDAFDRFIGDGSPCFVPLIELTPREVVQWIREAGGVAVVAHPGRGFYKGFIWDSAMLELKSIGVQGLEAYYSGYGPLEQRYFLQLAAGLDLVPCGGSDYHGYNKPHIAIGVGRGSLYIPDGVLSLLQKIRSQS